MVEELNKAGNLPPEDEPEVKGEPGEPESPVDTQPEESGGVDARLEELEMTIAGKDAEIAALRQDKVELENRLSVLSGELKESVAGYKAMVVQSNPDVVEELIGGETIESINKSLDKAKVLVSKVRQGIEAEISMMKIPAGAPERTSPDLSAMSPREKIQYAIGGLSS